SVLLLHRLGRDPAALCLLGRLCPQAGAHGRSLPRRREAHWRHRHWGRGDDLRALAGLRRRPSIPADVRGALRAGNHRLCEGATRTWRGHLHGHRGRHCDRHCRAGGGGGMADVDGQDKSALNADFWLFNEGNGRRMMRNFGVHSEVGKLRTVMVCRPSLAHQRLTPGNCHSLLFDDVIWVHEAQKDHYDFTLKMKERGVEVLELHDLLAESLNSAEARKFVLDRTITENALGTAGAAEMRPWLEKMPAEQLATYLIGGIAIADLPGTTLKAMMKSAFGESEFVMAPIPNT